MKPDPEPKPRSSEKPNDGLTINWDALRKWHETEYRFGPHYVEQSDNSDWRYSPADGSDED